jgi:hypothetical protein
LLNVTQFARALGVHPETISHACERGEIAGARRTSGNERGKGTGKRKGHWRIPVDAKWAPRSRGIDRGDFAADETLSTPRSTRADRSDAADLDAFAQEHATPEQAEAARLWMERNARRLPQLRRDPILERADREHPLLG